jgi:hypothetical protein
MATRQDLINATREAGHRQFDRRFVVAVLILVFAIMLTGFSRDIAHQLGLWLAG